MLSWLLGCLLIWLLVYLVEQPSFPCAKCNKMNNWPVKSSQDFQMNSQVNSQVKSIQVKCMSVKKSKKCCGNMGWSFHFLLRIANFFKHLCQEKCIASLRCFTILVLHPCHFGKLRKWSQEGKLSKSSQVKASKSSQVSSSLRSEV